MRQSEIRAQKFDWYLVGSTAWEWLLGSSRFRFQMRAQIAQAVETFRTGTADLSDYLILYLAEHEGVFEVMTFDRDFASTEGVTLLGDES